MFLFTKRETNLFQQVHSGWWNFEFVYPLPPLTGKQKEENLTAASCFDILLSRFVYAYVYVRNEWNQYKRKHHESETQSN